jgi:hypothetical protein
MSKRDWEVNRNNPSYRTRDGDISIKLQNGDDVGLRFNGYEYTISVSTANLSGISEGTIKSYRSISSGDEPEFDIGELVKFTFNNVFSVQRH